MGSIFLRFGDADMINRTMAAEQGKEFL